MPKYIVLGEFTQDFIEDIENRTLGSAEFAEEILDPLDVSLEAVYAVMGRYDFVAVVEAPDQDAAVRAVLATGAAGDIRTETLPAFEAERFNDLATDLPGYG